MRKCSRSESIGLTKGFLCSGHVLPVNYGRNTKTNYSYTYTRHIHESGHLNVSVALKFVINDIFSCLSCVWSFQQNLAPLGRESPGLPEKTPTTIHGKLFHFDNFKIIFLEMYFATQFVVAVACKFYAIKEKKNCQLNISSEGCTFRQNMSRASSLCSLLVLTAFSSITSIFFNDCFFWASLRISQEAVRESSPSITIHGFPR